MKRKFDNKALGKLSVLALSAILIGLGGISCSTTQMNETTSALSSMFAEDDPEKAAQIEKIGSSVTSVAAAMAPISFEVERSLGGGVAIRALSDIGPMHPNANLQKYVNLLGRVIAQESNRPDLPYAFAVLASDIPNAFSGPGGYVFVTSGALRQMSDEAELAGVLAHEIAHITELHMLKTYRRSNLIQGLAGAVEGVDADATQYTALVDEATETLFTRGLDKVFEYEADLVGSDLAVLAGYDPAGLKRFLTKLKTLSNQQGGWFSTHPALGDRITRLEAHLKLLKAEAPDANLKLPERFKSQALAILEKK
jgi:beta-barrel assembly-enhancing protease